METRHPQEDGGSVPQQDQRNNGQPNESAHDGVVFFIGEERFKEDRNTFTVRELLEHFAKEDPAETTLVLRHGSETVKYTNLDEVIEVKNGTRFVVYHNGPTPVS